MEDKYTNINWFISLINEKYKSFKTEYVGIYKMYSSIKDFSDEAGLIIRKISINEKETDTEKRIIKVYFTDILYPVIIFIKHKI